MYKLLLLLLLVPCLAYSQSGRRTTFLDYDSTTVALMTDSVPTPLTGKFRMFFAKGGDNVVHPYMMNNARAVTRLDSGNFVDTIYRTAGKDTIFWRKNGTTYSFKDSTGAGSGGGGSPRLHQRVQWSNTDSVQIWRIPPSGTTTIDSVVIMKTGSVAITGNIDKISSAGTCVKLFASDFTFTTSYVAVPSIQNNTVTSSDVLWFRIVTIGGIVPIYAIYVYYH